jgi:integrase
MTTELTDGQLRALPPPASGRLELVDTRCVGLAFRITSAGSRSWCFRYRRPDDGETTRFKIGNYPAVGLSAARRHADKLREQLAGGIDPGKERQRERQAAPSRTFGALGERYLVEHAARHKRASSAGADARNLRLHILPEWKERDIRKITRADAVELIEGLIRDHKPVLANRVGALLSKVFNFATDAGLTDRNPAARLGNRGVEVVGRRVLSDNEIRLFWSGIVEPPVSLRVGLALRLALLTATRASEIAGMHVREFVDLESQNHATWIIPSERTKNARTHLIPLSSLAIDTVQTAVALHSNREGYVFPSRLDREAPIEGHSLATAMRRFGESQSGSCAPTWRVDPPSPHDLRRTARTRLAALGVSREDCDAIMNHSPRDVGGRHYDLYARAKEKRAALDRWAAALSAIMKTPAGGIEGNAKRQSSR